MSQALAQPLLEHREAIARVCREHGVERLEVFGSAADGSFDPGRSDFDLIVRHLRRTVEASRRVIYERAAAQASA